MAWLIFKKEFLIGFSTGCILLTLLGEVIQYYSIIQVNKVVENVIRSLQTMNH